MARHVLARSLHDVGLATWFGGSLMGAVGLHGAAAALRNPDERSAAATVGWTRWAPVNSVAIGAHLLGAVQLLRTERIRVRRQDGVARSSAVKTGLTVAAVGATAYSGLLNRKMVAAGHVPVEGATEPSAATPPDVAKTQKQLKAIQWIIPALTGGLVATTAWQSEQMRPSQVFAGLLPSLPGFSSRKVPALAAGGAAAALLGTRKSKAKAKIKSAVPTPPARVSPPSPTPVPPVTPSSVDLTVPVATTAATVAGSVAAATDRVAPLTDLGTKGTTSR